jgi:hypothetical protein
LDYFSHSWSGMIRQVNPQPGHVVGSRSANARRPIGKRKIATRICQA